MDQQKKQQMNTKNTEQKNYPGTKDQDKDLIDEDVDEEEKTPDSNPTMLASGTTYSNSGTTKKIHLEIAESGDKFGFIVSEARGGIINAW